MNADSTTRGQEMLICTSLQPIVGAAFSQSTGLGWRWTEYFTVILTCSVLVLDLFFFPETFAPAILNAKARKLRWKTGRWEVSLHSRHCLLHTGD